MSGTPPKPDPKAEREARLAAALRENLKRRKAPAPLKPEEGVQECQGAACGNTRRPS